MQHNSEGLFAPFQVFQDLNSHLHNQYNFPRYVPPRYVIVVIASLLPLILNLPKKILEYFIIKFSCCARSSAVLLPPYLLPLYPNPFIRPLWSLSYSIIISFSERKPLLYNHDDPDLINYYVIK